MELYYAALDVIISGMEERFNSVNLSLMKAMQTLNPRSDSFMDHDVIKPLFSHYNIPGKEVEVELLTAKQMLITDDRDHDQLKDHGFYNRLSPVSEGFPTLCKCVKIAMTIGITSATAELSFSSL